MAVTTSCLSFLVVLATAFPSPSPLPLAVASPSTTSPAPSRIPVDASEIGTLSTAALDEIAAQATAEAAKHGLTPDQLAITLVVIDHLDVIRGVRVSITTPTITLTDPEGDPRGPLVARCQACAEAELKTVAIEGVIEALTRYEDALAAAEATRAAETTAAEAEPAPAPPEPSATPPDTRTRRPRRPLAPLGQAGVATLALGASAVVVGLVFVGLGNDRPPALLSYAQEHERHFATPGYALLGSGGAVAIAGAVMLGLDRRRARASTLAFAPHASPTTFGLHLHARF